MDEVKDNYGIELLGVHPTNNYKLHSPDRAAVTLLAPTIKSKLTQTSVLGNKVQ